MKQKYLAVYDYGMGGIWLFIYARSTDEIMEKYPELKVVEHPPEWLTHDALEKIEMELTFDIDEPPTGWLLSLVEGRQKN